MFSSSNTASNVIINLLSWDDHATSTYSCTDSKGDTFANTAIAHNTTNHQFLGICYATNIAGGSSNTVTVTFGAASTYRRIIAAEYSGVASTSPVDTTATNWSSNGTSSTNGVTSGSATTTTAGDLIIGGVVDAVGTTTITAGTGFTQRNSLNNKDFALQDQVQTTAGSIASTQTFGSANPYAANMVALKPAAGGGGTATPTYVQSNGSTNNTSATTITTTFSSSNTTSNAIINLLSWDDHTTSTFTCTDSKGDTFTNTSIAHNTTNHQYLGICYATNVAGGSSNVVTATFGAASTYRRIIASEYSGIATTNPVDVTATNWASTGTTTTNGVTSGSAPTTTNGDLIFGGVLSPVGTTTITAGTGFTQRNSLNNKDAAIQDKVLSTAGSVSSTQTFGSANAYVANMVAFRPATTNSTPPPTASFTTTPSSGDIPLAVNVDGTGSTTATGTTITGYSWNFGDTGTATGVTASHTYTTKSTFTITLTVTASNSLTGTTTRTVTTYNPPTASFTTNPTYGPAPLKVNFDASPSSADIGTITNYAWNFGDTGMATGQKVSHIFVAAGTPTVTLTVTDSRGGTATTTRQVNVTAAPALQFSLTWDNGADMDLYVTEPNQNVSYYGSTGPSSTGGTFGGDQGICNVNNSSTGGQERTSWASAPPPGTYTIGVNQYDTCGTSKASWTLQVLVNGTVVQTQSGTGDGPTNITYTGA